MKKTNPKVDGFFKYTQQWNEEFKKLRTIILDCDLTEEMKWGQPCYLHDGSNIVLMHGFKDYCVLLFFKGVLLKDPKKILVQQTENVQAGRQIRFTKLSEIVKLESTLKAYIRQAIKVEKSGVKIEKKKTSEYKVPEEFQKKLDENSELEIAFHALTPGRQRGYILYFSGAKQSKTREARVEKCIPQILDGKGLDD